MTTTCWRLERSTAHLNVSNLQASVDLLRPWRGLHDVQLLKQPLGDDVRLLRLMIQPPSEAEEELPQDAYARGVDLIATYQQTPSRPVRPQIYWRFLDFSSAEQVVVGWELILSIQTDLLDSNWRLSCHSDVPSKKILQLQDSANGDFSVLSGAEAPSEASATAGGEGLFLFHLEDDRWTYVEMVHPSDFYETIPEQGDAPQLTHWLFAERLEKGVIRRARVRGLFVPRDHDQRIALDLWSKWQEDDPPLTT